MPVAGDEPPGTRERCEKVRRERIPIVSYLNKHFYPFLGDRRLSRISPSLVQDWVTQAKTEGLAPRSIRTYHVFCPRSSSARSRSGSWSTTRATTPSSPR